MSVDPAAQGVTRHSERPAKPDDWDLAGTQKLVGASPAELELCLDIANGEQHWELPVDGALYGPEDPSPDPGYLGVLGLSRTSPVMTGHAA